MFLYADILKARLVEDITDSQTTITIDDASKLPTLGVGQYLVVEVKSGNLLEKMQCTNIAGDVLTVVRAVHYPYAFKAGSLCTIGIDPYGYELEGGGGGSGISFATALSISSLRM